MNVDDFKNRVYPQLEEFVLAELSKDCSGHNHQHAHRVVSNALQILKEENGDYVVVVTASILHDVIDHKLFEDTSAQLQKVKVLLEQCNFSVEELDEVLYIMQNISFSGGKSAGLKSLNAQIVCDADRLDALGAIGIIRTIEYGASKVRPFYNEENLKCGRQGVLQEDLPNTSLSHFYEKLLKLEGLMFTRFGKELAKQRTQFMFQFLQQFYDELGN